MIAGIAADTVAGDTAAADIAAADIAAADTAAVDSLGGRSRPGPTELVVLGVPDGPGTEGRVAASRAAFEWQRRRRSDIG